MTANLQLTIKDAARVMSVSERSVYIAIKLQRIAPELVPAIEAGEMTLNAAMAQIEKKPKPTTWDRLVKAWNAASQEDRRRLISEACEDKP